MGKMGKPTGNNMVNKNEETNSVGST